MLYTGYYINLDRAPERRAAMEAQFARMSASPRYRRFPAVDGNQYGFPNKDLSDSQLGCLASHYMLLQMHMDGRSHLHILEDDATMATQMTRFIDTVIAADVLDNYDILFTDTVPTLSVQFFRDARRWYSQQIQRDANGLVPPVIDLVVNL